ncbi:hypothetical protein PHMEG_00026614 [Phytophthora megakarya]|uniref:Uncharacterized protein n=1 Tax=Phytophthora megakarya TaxID=4795 RepID=A0A225V9B6_9STRA|nr:hypothetical protein PHMEG_00026614 [Phytophthora megakarya]
MVKWLSTKFQGYKVEATVLCEAANAGNKQFFYDNDNSSLQQLQRGSKKFVSVIERSGTGIFCVVQ